MTDATDPDLDQRLAQLAADLLGDAERLRKQLWEPAEIHAFGGRENVHNSVTLTEPTPEQKRAIVASVQALTSTVTDLRNRLGNHPGTPSLLEQLVAGLTAQRTEEQAA